MRPSIPLKPLHHPTCPRSSSHSRLRPCFCRENHSKNTSWITSNIRRSHTTHCDRVAAGDRGEIILEIQRYRVLRHKLLDHYREKAMEQSLRHIDLAELPPEMEDAARYHIRRNARIWRVDQTAAREIDVRFATYGYDSNAINTQVYLQARDVLLAFEALLNSAQNRRMSLLREINNRRHTGDNAKRHHRSE